MKLFYLKKILLILLFSLTLITPTFATKFAPATPHHVFSANKQYYIDANQQITKQYVMHIINNKPHFIWSFSYHPESDDLFISNDGKHAYVVRGKYVKIEDIAKPAVLVFTPKGLTAKYSYRQLSTPRKYHEKEVGPIGDFWRIWRNDVFEKNGYLLIDTTNKGIQRIQMRTGKL